MVLLIKDIFTPVKPLEFLHCYFHCSCPGSDHALSYPDRGHTSESTTLAPSHAFFTQQHADLSMPLLYLKPFKMTFPLPLNKNVSTDHGHSIVCGLVLPCPTTSSHVTSALIHSIPGHIMLPSAPPSKHVLTLGSLEVVTITPHDPLP